MQAVVEGERPEVGWLGIALSASSVVIMPYLGLAKQRIADQIGSAATPPWVHGGLIPSSGCSSPASPSRKA